MVKSDRGKGGLRSTLSAIDLNKSTIDRIYHFVLSYSPTFPTYEFENLGLSESSIILDPFCGTGTTLVAAKKSNIQSIGIEANDFCNFVSNVKLNWNIDIQKFRAIFAKICCDLISEHKYFEEVFHTDNLKFSTMLSEYKASWPSKDLLLKNHISDLPLIKLLHLKELILSIEAPKDLQDLLLCCFAAIVTPASNLRFGPTPGIGKIKVDSDIKKLFSSKCEDAANDIESMSKENTSAVVSLGDARDPVMYASMKVDAIITSPPYPAEHEYTRHTRLEMILLDMVLENTDIRDIKKRMITGSTRNVYKGDDEAALIANNQKITDIIQEISLKVEKSKIREDGTTRELSGFEKLYAKTVGEYFGGMKKFLRNALLALNDGGVASILVGDSRTYKLVHIPTAEILGELALEVGFKRFEIQLWRNNVSTAHKLDLNEYVLRLYK